LQSGAQVLRRVAVATAAAANSQCWLEYLLARVWDYLFSLLCCAILGERCAALCLAIYPKVCFRRNSQSRLRCSEGGFGLWLGDEGIVNGKTSTPSSIF
jgi:hypothetical protein